MSQIGYLEALNDRQLRAKCKEYGLPDVPVTNSSRRLLIRRILIAMGEIPAKKTNSRASTASKPRSPSPVKRKQSPGRVNKNNVSNVSHNRNANISSTTTTSPKPRATHSSSHKIPISLGISVLDDDEASSADEHDGNENFIVQKTPKSYGIRQQLPVAARPRPAVALKKTNLITTSFNQQSALPMPESLQHLEVDNESDSSSIPRSNRSVSLSRSEVVTTSYKQELAPLPVHEIEDDDYEEMEYSDYDDEEEEEEEEEVEPEQDNSKLYSNNNISYNKSYTNNSYEKPHSTSILNSTFKTPEPVGRTIIHPIRRATEPEQGTSTFLASLQQQQQQQQQSSYPTTSKLDSNTPHDYASKAHTTNVPFHINTSTTSPLSATSNTSLHHHTLNSPLTETSSEVPYTNRIYPSLPRQEYSSVQNAAFEPAYLTKRKTFVENCPQEQQNVNFVKSQQPAMQSYSKFNAFNNNPNNDYKNSNIPKNYNSATAYDRKSLGMRQPYDVYTSHIDDKIDAENANYSQEEDEEMDNASDDSDTTQTTYISQFARKLEQHKSPPMARGRPAILKEDYLTDDSKYHIKQTLALILCFILAVFIYVFFIQ